jgi:hypothetical protein
MVATILGGVSCYDLASIIFLFSSHALLCLIPYLILVLTDHRLLCLLYPYKPFYKA